MTNKTNSKIEVKDGMVFRDGKDPIILTEKELNGIEGYIKLLLVGRAVKEIVK